MFVPITDSPVISEMISSNNCTPAKQSLAADATSLMKSKSQESQLNCTSTENVTEEVMMNKQAIVNNSITHNTDATVDDIYISVSPLKSPRGSTSTDIEENNKGIISFFHSFALK